MKCSITRSVFASAALVALLSACHRDQKATGHGTVSGEILPGSVSDAMLPYDSVKSKAPLAPMAAVGKSGNALGDNAADNAVTAETAPDSSVPNVAASPGLASPVVGN